jgi:hypothetical protein
VLAYVHPVIGGAVLLLLVYVGSLGLRMRSRSRQRAGLAARHARLAPLAYVLTLLSWLGGSLSTLGLRHDLDWASTVHFRVGTIIVVFLSGSALTARWMRRGNPTARELHPWFGAGALLLAAAHAVTGLRIMP